VLAHDRRLTQIPIIRNIDQHVRAFVCERTRNRRVRGFYTNKNPGAKRAEGHQRIRTAGFEFADETSYRTSLARTYRALATLAYGQRRMAAVRRYTGRAVRAAPSLSLDRRTIAPAVKSLAGERVIAALSRRRRHRAP